MPGGQHQTDEAAQESPITAGRDRRAVVMYRATSSAAGAPTSPLALPRAGCPANPEICTR